MPHFDLAATTLIISDAYRTGWEVVLSQSPDRLEFASSRHKQTMLIAPVTGGAWNIEISFPNNLLSSELEKRQERIVSRGKIFYPTNEDDTLFLFSRSAELARSLPTAGIDMYERELQSEFAKYNALTTETERTIRARVGQNIFRASLLDYWGGRCAITGVDVVETLRASHIKPWAECECDSERLDVFNGLLLVANLDALFDAGIISFSDEGKMLKSSKISEKQISDLIPNGKSSIQYVSDNHKKYLNWHREKVFLV